MIKQKEENFAPMWELNPLWETLTDDERAYVENNVQIVSFAKNDIIHADGDESNCMYMLLQGKVRIYKEGVGQRLQIIRLLKPYDIFGYRACIAEGPYNSSASAFEDCARSSGGEPLIVAQKLRLRAGRKDHRYANAARRPREHE